MRRVVLGAVWLLLTGCAAPLSDGGVWSRQGLQQELAISRMSEQQRAATAHDFELQVADDALNTEQARIQEAIQQCSGEQRPSQDYVRASIMIRIGDDTTRLKRVAQQALADGLLRRAATTGSREYCALARDALVSVYQGAPVEPLDQQAQTQLVESALGWTDTPPAGQP